MSSNLFRIVSKQVPVGIDLSMSRDDVKFMQECIRRDIGANHPVTMFLSRALVEYETQLKG